MKYSVIATLIAIAAPGAAQFANPLALTTDPADRAVMAEAAAAVASRTPDIGQLDAVLAKLPRPTPMRGMVQTVRAQVLSQSSGSDLSPAVAAIEDALRLLPDDPRPKLVASQLFTFTGAPQRAADLWMEVSRQAPDFARTSDRYVMTALIGRLLDIGDSTRADRVNGRLGEIGFSVGRASERSLSALARTRQAVRDQHESEALANVTAISNPDDLLTLYVDQRYAMLWPRISEWAGPDLAGQSRRYLAELRSEWAASDDFEAAAAYADGLFGLRGYPVIAQLFPSMFDRIRPGVYEDDAERLAPIVARAFGRLGRDAEAQALLDKVAASMPSDDGGNALNIDGAYIKLAMSKMDWPQVIARSDRFLGRAKILGSAINQSAVLAVESLRACALSRTGHIVEAQQATAAVLIAGAVIPGPAMSLHLCRGDVAAGRAFLIARLADKNTRGWALQFVQPIRAETTTPLLRLLNPFGQAVRTSPDVLKAASAVGRVLPQPVNFAVPAGFDPFHSTSATKPLGPGAI